MRIISILFITCIILQSCIQTGGNNNSADVIIDLKLNFKPGVKYSYLNESDDTIGVPGMTKDRSLTTRVSTINTYSLTPAGNNKKIDFSFDKIVISSQIGEYNSDDTSGDLKVLNALKKQMHIHRAAIIDDKGEITNLQKDLVADTTGKDAFNSITMFDDDAILNSLKYHFAVYPGKPVKLGERWTKNINSNVASVKTTIPIEFRLISADSGIAHIELNAHVNNISDSTSQSILHFMNMKGSVTGTLDMEIGSGMIINYVQATRLVGTMNLGTQEVPATIISCVRVKGKMVK